METALDAAPLPSSHTTDGDASRHELPRVVLYRRHLVKARKTYKSPMAMAGYATVGFVLLFVIAFSAETLLGRGYGERGGDRSLATAKKVCVVSKVLQSEPPPVPCMTENKTLIAELAVEAAAKLAAELAANKTNATQQGAGAGGGAGAGAGGGATTTTPSTKTSEDDGTAKLTIEVVDPSASKYLVPNYDLFIPTPIIDPNSTARAWNATPDFTTVFTTLDLFPLEDKKSGAIALHLICAFYVFSGLAIISDSYFEPALSGISEGMQLAPDVAAATFMALGGSAPEFATAVVGTFVARNDIGIGTIIGSAVFNAL